MESIKYIFLGAIFLLAILFLLKDRFGKVWFKIPFFSGGVETSGGINSGGRGGNATSIGQSSTAIAGKGGAGGPGGKGGDGGDAHAEGDHSLAMGGEGGEAGQKDRGGRGGRGPLHVLMEEHPERFKEISGTFGITEEMAKTIGKGGDGAGPA